MGNSTSSTNSGSQSFERFDRSKGTVREQFYTRDRDQGLERANFHREQSRHERNTVIENVALSAAAGATMTSLGGPYAAATAGMTAGASAGIASARHIAQAISHETKAGQAQKMVDYANKVLENNK